MDYETISNFLLESFFLSDWERVWLEARFSLNSEKDKYVLKSIIQRYPKLLKYCESLCGCSNAKCFTD